MFYAIEYAYGRAVVNNGTRADRLVEFTRRELRDAWVAVTAGQSFNNAGYREALKARDLRIRKAHGLEDGNGEGWRALAEARVERSPALSRHADTIWYDWCEADHAKWVATAPEREILDWARSVGTEA